MSTLFKFLAVYFVIISVVSVIITIVDKSKAKREKWRVPEATLMLLGLFGGATAMFITMKTIHHKTLHKKFMIGLPLEILLHAVLICLMIYFLVS